MQSFQCWLIIFENASEEHRYIWQASSFITTASASKYVMHFYIRVVSNQSSDDIDKIIYISTINFQTIRGGHQYRYNCDLWILKSLESSCLLGGESGYGWEFGGCVVLPYSLMMDSVPEMLVKSVATASRVGSSIGFFSCYWQYYFFWCVVVYWWEGKLCHFPQSHRHPRYW